MENPIDVDTDTNVLCEQTFACKPKFDNLSACNRGFDLKVQATGILNWGLVSVMTGTGNKYLISDLFSSWDKSTLTHVHPRSPDSIFPGRVSFRWYLTPNDTSPSDTWVHTLEYHFCTFSPGLFLCSVTYYRKKILIISKHGKPGGIIFSWCFCHDLILNFFLIDRNICGDIWRK